MRKVECEWGADLAGTPQDLFSGPQGQKYFHNRTKVMLFAFFRVRVVIRVQQSSLEAT